MRRGPLTRDLGACEAAASGGGGWRGREGNPGGDVGNGVPGEVGADGLAWPRGVADGLA